MLGSAGPSLRLRTETAAASDQVRVLGVTLNVLSDLGRRINDKSGDARETAYLFQRISVAIQRFNSVLLHDSLIIDSPDL